MFFALIDFYILTIFILLNLWLWRRRLSFRYRKTLLFLFGLALPFFLGFIFPILSLNASVGPPKWRAFGYSKDLLFLWGKLPLYWCLGAFQWIFFARAFVKHEDSEGSMDSKSKESPTGLTEYLKGTLIVLCLFAFHLLLLELWTPLFIDMKCGSFACSTSQVLLRFSWLFQFSYIIPFVMFFAYTNRTRAAIGMGFSSMITAVLFYLMKLSH